MAMMNNGLRSSASRLINSAGSVLSNPARREIHSTGMKSMGGHGHADPYYMHSKHMYNLDRMKYQKVKMPLFVLGCFSLGVFVPVYAVIFQQKKASSG